MFRFEHKEYLLLLGIIPILVFIYIITGIIKKRNLKKFGEPSLLWSLMPDFSKFKYNLKFFLMILALSLLILAFAGPQFGTKLVDVKQKGIEVIVALDVSNSMLAEDIKPSRIERAKQELSSLFDKLDNDKVGLIVFAGEAYTQIPITSDIASAKLILSGISTNMVTRQGTALSSAIDLASNSFSPQSDVGRALIIISDGEDHEGDVMNACKKAVEKNIHIYTIGMGEPQGVRIPLQGNSYNRDYMRDNKGDFVITKLNEQMLMEIAEAGNGKYYRGSAPNMGLNDIIAQFNQLDQAEMDSKAYEEYAEQFPYFTWAVFFILVLDFIVFEKKNKWLKRII